MKPLYSATVEMSSETKVTASKIIPISKALINWYASELRKHQVGSFGHELCFAINTALTTRLGKLLRIQFL